MASGDQLRHVADQVMDDLLMHLRWDVGGPGPVVEKARSLGVDLGPEETAAVFDLLQRTEVVYTIPDETAEYTDGFRAGYQGLDEDESHPEWVRGFVDGQALHHDGDPDRWASAGRSEVQP